MQDVYYLHKQDLNVRLGLMFQKPQFAVKPDVEVDFMGALAWQSMIRVVTFYM